jgi:hypothetical protein
MRGAEILYNFGERDGSAVQKRGYCGWDLRGKVEAVWPPEPGSLRADFHNPKFAESRATQKKARVKNLLCLPH